MKNTTKEEDLRELLEELHLKLAALDSNDPALQEKAAALATQIRETLDQREVKEFHSSLGDALKDALLSFETSHPKLTQLVNGVNNLLSAIGV